MEKYPPADRLASEIAFVGIHAGILSFLILVRRGLVSPDEVEEYINAITSHLVPRADDPPERQRQIEKLRTLLEGMLLPEFAKLRESAKQHWKG